MMCVTSAHTGQSGHRDPEPGDARAEIPDQGRPDGGGGGARLRPRRPGLARAGAAGACPRPCHVRRRRDEAALRGDRRHDHRAPVGRPERRRLPDGGAGQLERRAGDLQPRLRQPAAARGPGRGRPAPPAGPARPGRDGHRLPRRLPRRAGRGGQGAARQPAVRPG
ncbi:MAG: hypothetical protein AVDCRST_MAG16-91 [uncultured Frankineae bacterium]|uniref:Uncharacterized protein n=1 Tax=uncultured Frankineae bacterium TaxID=437475 RepID=A0A6J4KMZ4_9ACTN|nr:MAG: hypothetical protein AVDCRST_MAG16-91 [uncultured Frankineae bacterium]